MAEESTEKKFLSDSGSGPGVAAWDTAYEKGQDGWSVHIINTLVKKEIFQKLTNEKKGLEFFVPLCGRSPDLMWLASQGYRVTGIDWVERAVEQFFVDNKLEYEVVTKVDVGKGKGDLYKAKDFPISIYLCDFFLLSAEKIGKFDCIWDSGSMTSFPKSRLMEYANVISDLMKPKANLLLSVFHYDQSLRLKPPNSVSPESVQELYGAKFDVTLAQSERVEVFRKYYNVEKVFDPSKFPYFNWNFHLIMPK